MPGTSPNISDVVAPLTISERPISRDERAATASGVPMSALFRKDLLSDSFEKLHFIKIFFDLRPLLLPIVFQ